MRILTAAAALALAAPAGAENPRFAYGKAEEATKAPAWAANVQLGFGAATGNAQSLSFTGGATASHHFSDNMLSVELNAALARTRIVLATDANGIPGVGPGEVQSITQTTTQAWSARARYDRFLAGTGSMYAMASAAANRPAGKQLVAGGQVGYSLPLLQAGARRLTVELGLDWSHQEYVATATATSFGSARAFLGWKNTPHDLLSYEASLEYLGNLTDEDAPTGEVSAFGDNRLTGTLVLSVKLWDHGSLGIRFRALYDSAPAPRPPPPGSSWEAGYVPLVEKLDTFTDLVLVYELL